MALVPDINIQFRLNGEVKTLRFKDLPFSAWSDLKNKLQFTPWTVIEAVQKFDLEAIGALIWLERRQHERMLQWATVQRELERGDTEFEFVDAYEGKKETDPPSADS